MRAEDNVDRHCEDPAKPETRQSSQSVEDSSLITRNDIMEIMKTFKIVTFVPVKDAEKVRMAMGDAGAGVLGNYTHASFSTKGVGRFLPGEGAHPAIGEVGKLEKVEEERIEVICQKEKVKAVVAAIKKAHPYEEIPLEIYGLLNGK